MIEREIWVRQLFNFVQESNLIEGIHKVESWEVDASVALLDLGEVHVKDLQTFVKACEKGAKLREKKGLDVRVGDHFPPPGGPSIRDKLAALLHRANNSLSDPYEIHVDYETLHPFTDCNGRSGRILWAWQMLHGPENTFGLSLGFLHAFYYQTLSHSRR